MSKGRNTKNKPSIGAGVAIAAAVAVGLWAAVAVLVGLLTHGKDFDFLAALASGVTDYRVWVIFICAAVGIGIAFAAREMRSGRRVLKINDIEDTHWMTTAEVRANENMTITRYSRLAGVPDGVPVYVGKQGRDMTVVITKPNHTLTVGATGTGKTTTFVDPVVQILSRTKTKPSLVVTDPKGELYRRHAATLKARGYDVVVLDVADPYRSARWNPFTAVIQKTRLIQDAERAELTAAVVQKSGKYIDVDGLVHDTFEQADAANKARGGFMFDGTTYSTEEQANSARKVYIQDLTDEIFIDLQDVVYTICPVTSQQDPMWEQGARNFILALAIAMWEDLLAGECDERTFNLHTLWKNVSDYATNDSAEILSEYLTAGRDEFSKAAGLAASVLSSQESDKTFASFLSTAQNYFVGFADSGVRRLTSGTEIDISEFDERPTALFIKIPDEKQNRHFIVTLLITQAYKVLVGKARQNYKSGETKDEELKRTVYVMMDEFGNLPKFPNIDSIITVGRSRKIFMMPIIQSFSQLVNKYGKDVADTIKSNCNVKIFIGSTDKDTINEFSELCGKTKQRNISFGDGTDDARFSVNTSAHSVPLVYPNELQALNDPPKMGNAVVLALGKKNPIRARFEPVFKYEKIYRPVNEAPPAPPEPSVFDEAAHYYNFATRRLIVARSEEFAQKQYADAMRMIDELTPDAAPPPFDPMDGADVRLMPLMQSVKSKLPEKLAVALESAFLDHAAKRVADACDGCIEYATAKNMRWLKAEAVKLKHIVLSLASRTACNDYNNDTEDRFDE